MLPVLNLNAAKLEVSEQKQENQITLENEEFSHILTSINKEQSFDITNFAPIFGADNENRENLNEQENQNEPEFLAALLDQTNLPITSSAKDGTNLDEPISTQENLTPENNVNIASNLNEPIKTTAQNTNFNLNSSKNEVKQELNLHLNTQITPPINLNSNSVQTAEISSNEPNLKLENIAPTPQILPSNLGQKIIDLVSKQEDNAYLELNPANLGKLAIKLNVQQNQLQIALNCDNSLVKNFLTGQITNLLQVLAPSFGQINVQIDSNLPQHSANQQQNQTSNSFKAPFMAADKKKVNEDIAPILPTQNLISYYV